ncbi:hypothetical protein MCC01970_00260 [Bifidobacteriaceae bacterium MCC01970]|nr:hypothetical protein MCC01970_00260 [Bifidobacteriaceae bacterium MCC01970]
MNSESPNRQSAASRPAKTQMTKMHYLAIRTVFNNEIAINRDEDLAKIIQVFVDQSVVPEPIELHSS